MQVNTQAGQADVMWESSERNVVALPSKEICNATINHACLSAERDRKSVGKPGCSKPAAARAKTNRAVSKAPFWGCNTLLVAMARFFLPTALPLNKQSHLVSWMHSYEHNLAIQLSYLQYRFKFQLRICAWRSFLRTRQLKISSSCVTHFRLVLFNLQLLLVQGDPTCFKLTAISPISGLLRRRFANHSKA